MAVEAVEPRLGLQAQRMVVVVINVAGLGHGEVGALGDDLADHPVEIVIGVGERRAVALAQRRSLSGVAVTALRL